MKNLFQLSGVKALNKKEQQSVKGGRLQSELCTVKCHSDNYCVGNLCIDCKSNPGFPCPGSPFD